MIVGLRFGKLLDSKFAGGLIVANPLLGTLLGSGCVVFGMCFVMVWLYDRLSLLGVYIWV